MTEYEQKPLTVDKLKKMAGEWVWIEAHDFHEEKHSGWGYLPKRGNDDVVLVIEHTGFWEGSPIFTLNFSFKDYGKWWIAYLHRPNELSTDFDMYCPITCNF